MAWAVFWSHIFCVLAPFGPGLCRIVCFLFSSLSFYSFSSLAIVSCHITLLFLLWCYLVQACWAFLGLLLMTKYSHLGLFGCIACGLLGPICFSLGHPWSICFLWASLALFLTLHSHGLFTNFFRLPWPDYLNFHHWGSWACHQPLTFFTCITLGLLWPILTFPHHILPMGLLFLSFRASLSLFASSRPICLFHGPVTYYSSCLGLMVFSIHLPILFYPCCWTSFYLASPKWLSTTWK